jgi:hypothetical protein
MEKYTNPKPSWSEYFKGRRKELEGYHPGEAPRVVSDMREDWEIEVCKRWLTLERPDLFRQSRIKNRNSPY